MIHFSLSDFEFEFRYRMHCNTALTVFVMRLDWAGGMLLSKSFWRSHMMSAFFCCVWSGWNKDEDEDMDEDPTPTPAPDFSSIAV